MIKTFKNKSLEKLFKEDISKKIPPELIKKLKIRLEVLDAAITIDDLRLPGYNLHELKGDRQGTWSIRITGNWRITFQFKDRNAFDVNLEDYH